MNEIKTEEEYKEILSKIEELFDAKPNTEKGKELLELVKLIEEYEDKNYPL